MNVCVISTDLNVLFLWHHVNMIVDEFHIPIFMMVLTVITYQLQIRTSSSIITCELNPFRFVYVTIRIIVESDV